MPTPSLLSAPAVRVATIVALLASMTVLIGCSSSTPRRARRADPVVIRDVPSVLRGTIGSEATINGADATLVSGYGLVVGLNGTGGEQLPDVVMSHMERELGRLGIGKGMSTNSPGLLDPVTGEPMSPRQLLRDPDTAVVIVQAAIPPGAPVGSQFDVLVRALNNSATSSLEGGTLWTTDLSLGPPTVFTGAQTRLIARARGPIYINAFAEPGAEQPDQVNRRVGRVIGGGAVTQPLEMELILNSNSHQRARSVVSAINSRFPADEGGPVARGRGQRGNNPDGPQSIAVRVPVSYRDRPDAFLDLLSHLQIDFLRAPQLYAQRYVDALKREPGLAIELSLCLEALGEPALPFIRTLYDYGEAVPRLAALRAGAELGDPLTAPHLIEIANDPGESQRLDAIQLLGRLGSDPTIDLALRELATDPIVETRVAAYEALAIRAERRQLARLIEREMTRPRGTPLDVSVTDLESLASIALPPGTIQGVFREPMDGGFLLDSLQIGPSLVYVTLRQEARMALLGDELRFQRPLLVSCWSDRLMLTSDAASDPIRIYYRDYRTGRVLQDELRGDTLVEFIRFATHRPTPEDPRPGLALSYAEIIGAVNEIIESGATEAVLLTQDDRLLADLLRARQSVQVDDRPESGGPGREIRTIDDLMQEDGIELPAPSEPQDPDKPTMVVPIERGGTSD